jgi:16S rRNA processing protein RimM
MPDRLLQIGYVSRAHGLRGELKIQLFDAGSEALAHIKSLWLGPPAASEGGSKPGSSGSRPPLERVQAGQGMQRRKIQALRVLGDGLHLVSLEGVSDRTAAEKLQSSAVYADRNELPSLDEDEYYISDIIGNQVLLANGEPVGTVRSILDTGGNSLMVVARAGASEALIPMVPEIVISVDQEARIVVIDPPEGLLAINDSHDTGDAGDADEPGALDEAAELDGAGRV